MVWEKGMKNVSWTVGILFYLLMGWAAAAHAQGQAATPEEEEPSSVPKVAVVLDLERPSDTDILLLRNGDKLTGTILNGKFSIRTSYASLNFNNRILAGIDLEGGANNIERIVTVNNNRFSGFIDDPVVVFKLQTGSQIEIRREKILKIIFCVRGTERKGISQTQFVILKNGDFFSGKILNENLIISTTYANVPLDLESLETITLIGGNNPLTKVAMRNGDTIQGVLETEDIQIDLDIGNMISVYKDRINVLYGREGYIPDIAGTGQLSGSASGNVVFLTTAKDDLSAEIVDGGVLITNVPRTSAYYGQLRAGDRVIEIDDIPYMEIPDREIDGKKGRLTPMRLELLQGKRAQIGLTVERDGKNFSLSLRKK